MEPAVADILRELLAAENFGPLGRLDESTIFISSLFAGEHAELSRIARESGEHGAWLSRVLVAATGSVGPRRFDLTTADLHFQELHHALPRVIRSLELLVGLYEAALPQVNSDAQAAELVSRILSRRREHLSTLRPMVSMTGV